MEKERSETLNNFGNDGHSEEQIEDSTDDSFFSQEPVKVCKDLALKNRLQALISSKGLKESEFYTSLGFSKQYWYEISWGIFPTPTSIKIKISTALEVDSRSIWPEEKEK